jgi:iron-sulfur cluster repair protein YtfE (RIC family)
MKLSTLLNSHVDITSLGHTILFASAIGALGSREQLTLDLQSEIKEHFKSQDSLFDALKDKDQVRELISNLQSEHEDIEDELSRLAGSREKSTVEWTSGFEDFILLLDQHFQCEERELLPQVESLLTGPRASALE